MHAVSTNFGWSFLKRCTVDNIMDTSVGISTFMLMSWWTPIWFFYWYLSLDSTLVRAYGFIDVDFDIVIFHEAHKRFILPFYTWGNLTFFSTFILVTVLCFHFFFYVPCLLLSIETSLHLCFGICHFHFRKELGFRLCWVVCLFFCSSVESCSEHVYWNENIFQ